MWSLTNYLLVNLAIADTNDTTATTVIIVNTVNAITTVTTVATDATVTTVTTVTADITVTSVTYVPKLSPRRMWSLTNYFLVNLAIADLGTHFTTPAENETKPIPL